MMSPAIVEERLRAIHEARNDDELAHGLEDCLYFGVLKAIADSECEDPVECARLAIKSKDIDFERWRV